MDNVFDIDDMTYLILHTKVKFNLIYQILNTTVSLRVGVEKKNSNAKMLKENISVNLRTGHLYRNNNAREIVM